MEHANYEQQGTAQSKESKRRREKVKALEKALHATMNLDVWFN
jgi:hypothetical protein